MKTVPATPVRLAAPALALACAICVPALHAQSSLSPLIVTAPRFAEAAESLPMGVSVITADEIRASGAANVTDALVRLLGVPGRQDFFGGGEYSLDLRGFGSTADNNQVVIIDGQRLSEADLGGTRLAGIPIEAVERIEVLRGSGSVLYGEGATGGVIVITTRAGADKSRTSGASGYAGVGSYGLTDLRANATLARGGFSLDANVQQRSADNHRDNFRSELRTGSLTAQVETDGMRLGATLAQEDLDARLPGALTLAQYEADPSVTSTPNDFGTIRAQRAAVFARLERGDWQVAADAGHRTKKLRSVNQGFPFDYDIDAETYALRARHSTALGSGRNVLVVGYDRNRWSRETLTFGQVASQSSGAWYLKDDFTFSGGTRLSAGVRTESADKDSGGVRQDGSETAWEIGASHPFASGLTAYARVGRSFRLANVDEFSFTMPGVILSPQTSRDVELGLRWVHAAGRVEARLYRSSLRGEIGFDPLAPAPFFPGANVNFDPTRRQGLEVDAVHALTRTVGLRVNAAIRDAKLLSGPYAGRDIPLVPRRTLAVRADWAVAPGHRLAGGVNWVSSQAIDFLNTCTVPAYAVADARYAYTWKNAELSLGVQNLFDRTYFTQAFSCAGGRPTAIYPEPGRTFTAAVRVSF